MTERRTIQAEGQVLRQTPHGLYEVRMPNGYEPAAHFDQELKADPPILEAGDRVLLEFSPYDMTSVRILRKV